MASQEPEIQSLFGFAFRLRCPAAIALGGALSPPVATVELVDELPNAGAWRASTPLFAHSAGPHRFTLFGSSARSVLSVSGVADFLVLPDRIAVAPGPEHEPCEVEGELLGSAMALWLEQRGVLALHGAALARGSEAAIFLGDSGTGKSTLAAAALKAGWTVLSEDLVAVEVAGDAVTVRPSIPAIRLWPETIRQILGLDVESLQRVDPRFDKRWVPIPMDNEVPFARLTRIYELNRTDGVAEVRIEPRRASEAIVAMTRDTFTPRSVVALGWHGPRLERLAACARVARFARLTYPSGFDRLPELLAVVAADMDS